MTNEFFDEPQYLVVKERLDEVRAQVAADREARRARVSAGLNGHARSDGLGNGRGWRALLEAALRRPRASDDVSVRRTAHETPHGAVCSESCTMSAPGEFA